MPTIAEHEKRISALEREMRALKAKVDETADAGVRTLAAVRSLQVTVEAATKQASTATHELRGEFHELRDEVRKGSADADSRHAEVMAAIDKLSAKIR